MKQVKMMLYVCGVLLMLIGCSDNTNEPSTNNEEENNMNVESSEEKYE